MYRRSVGDGEPGLGGDIGNLDSRLCESESALSGNDSLEPGTPVLDAVDGRKKQRSVSVRANAKVRPCVSFNTVPLPSKHTLLDEYEQDFPGVQLFPQEYTMEEYYDDESGYVSEDNQNYMLHNSYITPEIVERLNKNATTRSSSPPPLDREYPSAGKQKKMSSKQQANITKMFKIAKNGRIVREDYPSRPTLVNDAFILNRDLNDWHNTWRSRRHTIEQRKEDLSETFEYPQLLFPQQTKPSEPVIMMGEDYKPLTKEQRKKEKIIHKKIESTSGPRVVLCHISGKRHTWVGLDWTIKRLSNDGDHIVVLAHIPRMISSRRLITSASASRSRSRTRSRSRDVNRKAYNKGDYEASAFSLGQDNNENLNKHEDFVEWASGYSQEDVETTMENIFDYIANILPEERSVKITVEVVVGAALHTIIDATNAYQPDLMVASTLRWERTDNLVLWKSNLLIDKLATVFPLPLFVVPARRMFLFEHGLEEESKQIEISLEKENIEMEKENNVTGDIVESEADKKIVPPKRIGTIGPPERRLVGADSFTAGFNMKRPSLGTSVSAPIAENVFEEESGSETGSDVDSELSDLSSDEGNDKLTVREKLHLKARSYRLQTAQYLKDLDNNKSISHEEIQIKKVETIINQTIKFSLAIEDLGSESDDDDDVGLTKLKRVITGGAVLNPQSGSKKSMLSVLDNPKTTRKKKSLSATTSGVSGNRVPRSSQIKFASSVKHKDGNNALGNSVVHTKPQIQVHAASEDSSPKLTPIRSYNTGSSNQAGLKTMKSNNSLRRVKSNDSSRISQSSKKSSSSTSSGGFMSLFKGKSKERSESPSSKRKSGLKFW